MRRSVLPALVLAAAMALTGCGADGDSDEAAPTPTPPASSPSEAAAAEPTTPPAVNERGNVPLQLMQPGEVIPALTAGAPPRLAIVVQQIAPDIECDSSDDPPVNGHFVGLEIRVETSRDYDPRTLTVFHEYDFAVLAPDGTPVTDGAPIEPDESNGPFCLDPEVQLSNYRFPPGEHYTGWMVLDVPVNAGTIVYTPEGSTTGYEWQFG